MAEKSISQLAASILEECSWMEKHCEAEGTPQPSLAAGANRAFWSETSAPLSAARMRSIGLLEKLTTLLQGPHDFLHEMVAPNWDHGALYAFLRSQALDHLAASEGGCSLNSLSAQCGIPEDKLFRILELLRCRSVVDEPENGIFTLTAVSEEMVHDGDFRAWVEFQLFETRVASAHLADALANKPNDYTNGTSGFKQGWGMEMYDWHALHAEKGDRFRRAMKGVSKSLDPADDLIHGWIQRNASDHRKIVEIGGRYGFASTRLATQEPALTYEVRCDSEDFLRRGEALIGPESKDRITFSHVSSIFDTPQSDETSSIKAYVVRNVFWNWNDDKVVKLLQTLLPTLRASPSTRILVTDGVSPVPKQFPPHVEIAYRRRDITTMTMHNVKQRTQDEWLEMFAMVDPRVQIKTTSEISSHVCKGLWELSLSG